MDLRAANFWFPKWLGYWYIAIWTFLVFLVEMGLEPLKTAAGLRRIPSENQFIRRIASDFFFVFFFGHFSFFVMFFPSFRYFCVFLVSHYVFGFVFLPGSSTDHPLRRLALSMGAAGASLCPLFGIFVQKHSLKNQIYRYILYVCSCYNDQKREGKIWYIFLCCICEECPCLCWRMAAQRSIARS